MQMCDSIASQVKEGAQEIDVLHFFARAALEYIGRGIFGQSFGPLDDERTNAHSLAVKRIRSVYTFLHAQDYVLILKSQSGLDEDRTFSCFPSFLYALWVSSTTPQSPGMHPIRRHT